jgi:putative ABC transport system permease protein
MNNYYSRNQTYEISAFSMESMVEQMASMLDMLKLAISAIAAIALLVGGIGVMNIMLVSVTERTREIGTRKALGARNSQIRMQFMVEAIILCLIGGVIGIALGLAMGSLGASLLGFPMYIAPGIILLCVMFSMMVGIFFGSYPASKASKMDPIEALRYE